MQQKPPTRISVIISEMLQSPPSRFQQRNQQMVIKYIIKELGLEEDVAWILVNAHFSTTTTEIMNLFLYNDEGLLEHFYVGPKVVLADLHHKQEQKQEDSSSEDGIKRQTSDIKLGKGVNQNSQQSLIKDVCRVCGQPPDRHLYLIESEDIEQLQKIYQKNRVGVKSQLSEEDESTEKHSSFILDPLLETLEEKIDYSFENEGSSFECQICDQKCPRSMMVVINQVEHGICAQCMTEYLREEIMNLRVEVIGCPHCGEVLHSETIKGFVNHVIFEKYKTFIKNVEIQKNPNLKWCPNPKCSVIINVKTARLKRLKCPKCNVEICKKCNREYHPKLSCNAVIMNQLKGLENAKDIQKCKKCKALVEKVSGCNHMTCSMCRYEWCWLCGSTFTSQHFSSLNPFGCAGMQDQNYHRWGKCKIYAIRSLMLLGFMVLIPILLPLAMLFCGPVITIFSISDRCKYGNRCLSLLAIVLIFPFSFIIDPIVWVWAIIHFTPYLIEMVCEWVDERRRVHEFSENNLKRRLIEDQTLIV